MNVTYGVKFATVQERSLCWEKLGLRLAMQVADRWKLLISRESYDAF